MSEFEWPAIYHFPPFFTKQRNEATERQRLDDWVALILSYCAHRKMTELALSAALESALFNNEAIERRLREEEARLVLQELVSRGNAEWLDEGRTKVLILFRSLAEWSALVYAYVDRTGQQGSVLTVYELVAGEDTSGEEFYGLDEQLMVKILTYMEQQQQKCKLFAVAGKQGVKFV